MVWLLVLLAFGESLDVLIAHFRCELIYITFSCHAIVS
jgi:hypothetical protein